jgi:hypothetical protein
MPKLRLYELVNADGASTSPFVWRVKFALQFKGLDYTRRESASSISRTLVRAP